MMIRTIARTTTLTMTALALVATAAWAQGAPMAGHVTGTVSHIDAATRTIHFVDGRMVRLEPGAVIIVNGREVAFDALTPGSNTVVVSRAPATGTVSTLTGHPPVDVSGTVVRVDPQSGLITLQDGRMVTLTSQSTVWQAAGRESIQPGAQIFIQNAQPALATVPGPAISRGARMGTVASVDEANALIVLNDGTVVGVAPGTRLHAAGKSLTIWELRPGDELIIRPLPRPVVISRSTVAGPGGYASPPRGAFSNVTIEADEIQVMRHPQSP
jgi:hypothetical protein